MAWVAAGAVTISLMSCLPKIISSGVRFAIGLRKTKPDGEDFDAFGFQGLGLG